MPTPELPESPWLRFFLAIRQMAAFLEAQDKPPEGAAEDPPAP